MAQNSKIEWTHHTGNLWWGCTEVHAGCDNCYARVLANRWGEKLWGNDVPRRAIKSVWKDLAKYQREAKKVGEIHRVFVGSMMDIFEKSMPVKVDEDGKIIQTTGALRSRLFYEIGTGEYPNLMFLFLTKRPSNINKYIPEYWKENPPSNVTFGTSPVDQKTADTLIPQLMNVKGRKFLSVEPMLGPIDFRNVPGFNSLSIIDELRKMWVICGGESGHHKRPLNLLWARSLRDQCKNAGVPYFFKQIDKIQYIPEDLQIRQFPTH